MEEIRITKIAELVGLVNAMENEFVITVVVEGRDEGE